jgi:hypothetical protein
MFLARYSKKKPILGKCVRCIACLFTPAPGATRYPRREEKKETHSWDLVVPQQLAIIFSRKTTTKQKKTHATCLTGLHKNDDSQWLFNTLATRQRAHAMQSYRDTSGREQFFFFFLPTTSPIFKSQMFDSKFLKSTFSHSR